ncbi:MAG: NUDIX hydrolase [Ignavibacteria bacterium]|nr:NUDIX hydrolase [Ignavibacteria bacterium]
MLIVVAGPYSAATEEARASNLKEMNKAAAEVYRKGHIPVIGVNAALYVADELKDKVRNKVIADISYSIVERCDAILLIGHSPGADIELEIIKAKGLPVYYSINDIPQIS